MVRPDRAGIALAALAALLSVSCGSRSPIPSRPTDHAAAAADAGVAAVGGGGAVSVVAPPDPAELADPLPRHEGPPPRIGSIDDAAAALAHGWYEEAEHFLTTPPNGSSGRAGLLLARVMFETGRYDAAGQAAERAAADATVRTAATTLRGEVAMHRGRLAEAQRLLEEAARDPHGLRAEVMLGRLLVRRGRAVEAEPHFMRLIQAYNDESIDSHDAEGLAYVAMSAWGLGSVQDANDAFQESTRADDQRVETQLEWAQMFLEKYDAGKAEESVRAAFAVNPSSAEGHAIMARIVIEQSFDFAAATRYAERALEIDPSLVAAHVALAGMDLRDLDIAAADHHLDDAAAIDPTDLDELSVRAAVRFLADDAAGFRRAKQNVLAQNPRFSRMYTIIADYADWEHRYPEIVSMAREAVTLDPTDAFAHATLGLNLLRMGEEQEGLAALREAWRRDHFNVHVYNTLNLYDDVIPEYDVIDSPPFIFRFQRAERPILEPLVPPMMRRAYEDMRRRYGFTPEGPIRVEMYANAQHFAVRTTGLPNLGVQGVCFGKVVTAISPAGGPFNWGQITWHELSHVFHIQMSHGHVPRWFTEGLAEYETIIARPEWKREDDYRLMQALDHGTLPSLRDMNHAFTHARSPDDMMTAYYASSMIVKYVVDRFGFDPIPRMLRAWGTGQRSPEVVQSVLGISIDDLDRDFREHTRQRLSGRAAEVSVDFADYLDIDQRRAAAEHAPDDAAAQAGFAAAALVRGDAEGAAGAARRAIAIESANVVARFVLARIAMASHDGAQADQHLRAILAAGKDGYDLRVLLARAADMRGDAVALRRELEAAVRLDPDRPEAWQGLMAVSEGDAALRARAVEHLAAIDQHDREAWGAWLEILESQERWPELVAAGESAQFVDPHSSEVHRRLGQALMHTGRPRDALAAFDLALAAEPESPGPVHLARAAALAALGRHREAREAAAEAARVDPTLADEARRIR